jgi:hypothetical protein
VVVVVVVVVMVVITGIPLLPNIFCLPVVLPLATNCKRAHLTPTSSSIAEATAAKETEASNSQGRNVPPHTSCCANIVIRCRKPLASQSHP